MTDMPILERRRIEALVLKHVYETAKAKYGEDDARALIGEAVTASAVEHGKGFAEALGHAPSLKDFADIMPLWQKEDALRIEPVRADDAHLDFNVVRCRYSEMYKEMGLGDIGHLLSCNRDGDFCLGYNPAMKLTRTQTIMKGASHCDFRYRMETEES